MAKYQQGIQKYKVSHKNLKMTMFAMLEGLQNKIKNFDRKLKSILKNLFLKRHRYLKNNKMDIL